MKKINYKKVLVKKPWGSEYLFFENKDLAIWFLNINYNKKTSLHCHPQKKTGFILLDGIVDINIGFYDKKRVKPLEKIMIRPGLFHQTKAISKKGVKVIEVESPKNKEDLVRFRDSYGRQSMPYEGKKYMSKLSKDTFLLNEKKKIQKNNGYSFKVQIFDRKSKIKFTNRNEIHAVLSGGLGLNKKSLVLCPGDIVRKNTINKLSKVFRPIPSIKILTISKC